MALMVIRMNCFPETTVDYPRIIHGFPLLTVADIDNDNENGIVNEIENGNVNVNDIVIGIDNANDKGG